MLLKFWHILAILVSSAIAISATAQNPLLIDGAKFDFGQVPQNATLHHQVWLRCSGSDTVTLGEIKTGCGCLVISPERRQIVPGDSLMLSCYWQRPVELTVGGNVVTEDDSTASLHWWPQRIEFRPTHGSREKNIEQVITLTNRTQTALSVTLVGHGPELDLGLPESIPAAQTAHIQVAVAEAYPGGDFESSFTFELTGNQGESFRVSVPVVSGDFSFRPIFTTTRQ